MFIHQPQNLGGIHRRTAAQSDNDIRLEGIYHIDGNVNRAQIRIRFNIGENLILNAQTFQNIGDFLGITQIEQWFVGNQKSFFAALQFFQCQLQRTRFEINFFRNFEPQHIFFTHCHCFNVHQMFNSYVFADRVAAPGAAA